MKRIAWPDNVADKDSQGTDRSHFHRLHAIKAVKTMVKAKSEEMLSERLPYPVASATT